MAKRKKNSNKLIEKMYHLHGEKFPHLFLTNVGFGNESELFN